MRITVTGSLVLFLTFAGAAAADWNTNLPSFQGGSCDGWDGQGMISAAGLGNAQIMFSSVTNQVLAWTQPQGVLTTLTIRVVDPGSPPMITNGGVIRLSVPSAWPCRFDTGATLSFSSNAAGKVSTSVSYIGGERTLVIPVTADFTADDTLAVSGLALFDLHLCPAGPQKLTLDLDVNGTAELYDACTVDVSVLHPGGPFDGWNGCQTGKLQWYRIVGMLLTVL